MYYALIIMFFIIGTVFGSFYNVVGYRIPKGESILYPSSHCPKCNHKLKPMELIPILSFLFLGGKCKNCGEKISWFYPIFEFTSGILFALCFVVFGYSLECLFYIVFISMLLIIIISDYQTMIIPDSVLIVSLGILTVIKFFMSSIEVVGMSLLAGVGAFIFMLLLKLFGDFLFKKESMGGGDIKLMFIIGLFLGFDMSIVTVFIASFIALPLSVISLIRKNNNVLPFGPYLSIAATIILFCNLNLNKILLFFTK